MIIDLHNHAEYSRNTTLRLFDYINWGKATEISFAITEHNFLYPKEGYFEGVLILPGMEVLNDYGDYLVFGTNREILNIKDIFEMVDEIHKQGGVVIAAHPFHGFGVCNAVDKKLSLKILRKVDAIEVNGRGDIESRNRAIKIARKFSKPLTGGSDAHSEDEIARIATKIQGDMNSLDDLVKAIREGNCEPIILNKGY